MKDVLSLVAPAGSTACRKDPDWLKARDESEKDGKTTNKVESVITVSTNYATVKGFRR